MRSTDRIRNSGGWHDFPRRFLLMLRTAVRSGVISPPTAAELTGLTIDEISELIADGRGEPPADVFQEFKEYADSGLLE